MSGEKFLLIYHLISDFEGLLGKLSRLSDKNFYVFQLKLIGKILSVCITCLKLGAMSHMLM